MSYVEYFLNSASSVVQLDTIEISHSSFSKTYYIVRNKVGGLSAKIEGGYTRYFDYYPIRIVPMGSNSSLDQSLTVTFGDLGEVVPVELELVANSNNFLEKPMLKYRLYRSDDLEQPLFGPFEFEIKEIRFSKEGCTFEAIAPSLNLNKTGEIYTLDRFTGLRGFL